MGIESELDTELTLGQIRDGSIVPVKRHIGPKKEPSECFVVTYITAAGICSGKRVATKKFHIFMNKSLKNTLLHDFIESANFKSEPNTTYKFFNFLNDAYENGLSVSLRKKTKNVTRDEIKELFEHAYRYSIKKDYSYAADVAIRIISCLKFNKSEFKDSDSLEGVWYAFKSTIKRNNSRDTEHKGGRRSNNPAKRLIISELNDPSFLPEDPELASPISQVKFSNLKELQKKLVWHLKARNNKLEETLLNHINGYLKCVEEMDTLTSQSLEPKQMKIFNKLQVANGVVFENTKEKAQNDGLIQFHFNILLKDLTPLERLHLQLHCVNTFNDIKNNSFVFKPSTSKDDEEALKVFDYSYCLSGNTSTFAHYANQVISRCVLFAAKLLLQLWLGYNSHTALYITRKDIEFHENGDISLDPTKGKTGESQYGYIKSSEKNRVKIINLIIKNYEINKDLGYDGENLFAALYGDHEFKIFYFCSATRINLLEKWALPQFTEEQIRDQAICLKLAETQNMWQAMRLAGHASLKTLIDYTDQSIVRIANEANMSHFLKNLETSIIWATRGEAGLSKHNINIEDVDKHLLFPITDDDYEGIVPEVDDWVSLLESNDHNSTIYITDDRIEWCLRQYQYYSEHWQEIRLSNPERFESVHLKRILFCTALKQCIEKKYPHHYLVQSLTGQ